MKDRTHQNEPENSIKKIKKGIKTVNAMSPLQRNYLDKFLINSRINENDPIFPNGNGIYPDCSSITDDELTRAIESRWPITHGVSVIPYSIEENKPYWLKIFLGDWNFFTPETLSDELRLIVSQKLRATFDKWTVASNHTLIFEERKISYTTKIPYVFDVFSDNGISIYLGGTVDYFSQSTNGMAGAFTTYRHDNNGYIKNAFIFFPNDLNTIWKQDGHAEWAQSAWSHEIGHALGFEHLHEYEEILNKLMKNHYGEYCSVMPYPNKIGHFQNSYPEYAVYPATLDARLVQLAQSRGVNDFAYHSNKISSYGVNLILIAIFSATISSIYYFNLKFLNSLKKNEHQQLIPKKLAALITDASIVSLLLFAEIELFYPLLFLGTALTKYTPERFLQKLPQKMRELLTSSYSLYALNIATTITLGTLPPVLAVNIALSTLTTYSAAFMDSLSQPFSYITNKSITFFSNKCCHQVNDINEEQEQNEDHIINLDYLAPAVTPPRARSSFCSRLHNWFGFGNRSDTNPVADSEEIDLQSDYQRIR